MATEEPTTISTKTSTTRNLTTSEKEELLKNQKVINEKLLEDDFYIHSLSLMMQNSFGVKDRCKLYVSILRNVVLINEAVFSYLDIFNLNLSKSDGEATSHYGLDLIGDILGLPREIVINDSQITLNNFDYQIYLEAQIIKNTYDGTKESSLKLYTGTDVLYYENYIDLGYTSEELQLITNNEYKELPIINYKIQYVNSQAPLEVYEYLNSGNPSDNLKLLFNNGYLTIDSLGIIIRDRRILENVLTAIFPSRDEENGNNALKTYLSGSSYFQILRNHD